MDDVVEFEARLFGIAYRMLGSATEAEDIVQETYLRWSQAEDVETPSAWLATAVNHLLRDFCAASLGIAVVFQVPRLLGAIALWLTRRLPKTVS